MCQQLIVSAEAAVIAQRVAAASGCVALRWWCDPCDSRFLCIEAALARLPADTATVVLTAFLGNNEPCSNRQNPSPECHTR
jgi:hypothetical protein